jgi:hypothetical protein
VGFCGIGILPMTHGLEGAPKAEYRVGDPNPWHKEPTSQTYSEETRGPQVARGGPAAVEGARVGGEKDARATRGAFRAPRYGGVTKE